MGIARKVTVGVISLLGLLVVGGGGFYVWASSAARARLAVTHSVHRVDFPIPFPLAEPELAALRAERSAIASPGPALNNGDILANVDLGGVILLRPRDHANFLVAEHALEIGVELPDFLNVHGSLPSDI